MMKRQRPYILISNDDGFFAKGINFLIDTLKDEADIIVVAPDSARSGYALAITSMLPVQVEMLKDEEHLKVYACTGTPGDCIKLALNRLVERKPDLVISGINHGDNSSVNSHYSGTMGAACEGALQGIPALAFSLCDHRDDANFQPLKTYILDFYRKALVWRFPPFTCLNINFPKVDKFAGVRICRMARSRWINEIEDCERNGYSAKYYWLSGSRQSLEPEAEDTDIWALSHDYVAVTPTTMDNTAYDLVKQLRQDY